MVYLASLRGHHQLNKRFVEFCALSREEDIKQVIDDSGPPLEQRPDEVLILLLLHLLTLHQFDHLSLISLFEYPVVSIDLYL